MATNLNRSKDWMDGRLARSPVRGDLIGMFASAPFESAPERSGELVALTQRMNIQLRLDIAGQQFNLQAFNDEKGIKRVSINLITLEKIWALSYGYLGMLIELEKNPPGANFAAPLDLTILLSWAHNTEHCPLIEWPLRAPRPDQPTSGPYIDGANGVFSAISSWMILHEIGHHFHGDAEFGYDLTPGGEFMNHAMEFNADRWATRRILESWRSYPGATPHVFIRRGFSIGLAILIFAAEKMVKLDEMCSQTHPSAVSRLRGFFEELSKMFGREFPKEIHTIKYHLTRLLFSILETSRLISNGQELDINQGSVDECLDYIEAKYSNFAFMNRIGQVDVSRPISAVCDCRSQKVPCWRQLQSVRREN